MLRKSFLLSLALILIPYISQAEIKTYTHTVKQTFGGGQSPDNARVSGIAKAKREVLEKAVTYLESLPIVKESMVERDEIFALASGVLEAQIVSQRNFATENAFGIMIVAKVDVYTNILEERIKRLLQDRSLLEKYNESQTREKELLARIKELEIENQKLKTLPPKEQKQKKEILENQFREITQGLTASELRNKALAFWNEGKYTDPDKALEYLNKAISLDPNYFYAYTSRGNAWYFKGDYDRAISDYNKAIELNPKDTKAYKNRGNVWYRKGNYDRAISDYNKAIELNPRYDHAFCARGIVWYRKGNYDRAISDYNKAIELNPRYDTAYLIRGNAWNRKGDYDRAISDYSKVIELNPRHPNAYNSLAWLLATCPMAEYRDGRKAVSLAQKAIEINPKHYIFDTLAAAYAEAGDFKMAVEIEQKAYFMENRSEYKNMIEVYKKKWTYTEYQKRKN